MDQWGKWVFIDIRRDEFFILFKKWGRKRNLASAKRGKWKKASTTKFHRMKNFFRFQRKLNIRSDLWNFHKHPSILLNNFYKLFFNTFWKFDLSFLIKENFFLDFIWFYHIKSNFDKPLVYGWPFPAENHSKTLVWSELGKFHNIES